MSCVDEYRGIARRVQRNNISMHIVNHAVINRQQVPDILAGYPRKRGFKSIQFEHIKIHIFYFLANYYYFYLFYYLLSLI